MQEAWGKLLHPLSLTSSGRPQLLEGEVELHLLSNIDLEPDPSAPGPPLKGGLVILTSYRILWINEDERNGVAIPLAAVSRVIPPKKSIKAMFASPRLRLEVWLTSEGTLSIHPHYAVSTITLSLAIRGQSSGDSFVARLLEVLHSKAWEVAPLDIARQASSEDSAHATAPGPSRLKPAMAGVSGILRKEQEQWEETDKNLQDAFVDLNALMSKAKEMVVLAERMRAKLLSGGGGAQAADEELVSKQDMQDWLLSVGIASPVTKESAGALYHQQLSRQLADFVRFPLQKAGGMMALVDVYCLFNRARGTELISPEDLLQALLIWERIDVPVMLRRFDSGVMIIQSKSQSDEEVFSRIRSLLSSSDTARTGVSASDAARALGIPPALAKEQLLTAESKGSLCRDDGPDGLRFFLNFFKEVEV